MTRNDFMKCCAAGVCGCGALAAASPADAADSEIDVLKGKLDFTRTQFARLVDILNQNVDDATRGRIWESLGREHGKDYHGMAERYKGNVPGFLEEVQKQWVEKAEYDRAAGTIRITDRATACSCPLVDTKRTPPEFCNCTLGWQKEVYSIVAGRPVNAVLEESILRGGTRCVFTIQIL